ncbi:MAG: beta-N-acetylhexosaminidase [Chromatiales bacterium]|jgi:beta-N-acetylhexosaminidase|nr:beta-N-acetylhexosaminidase [Chromatiales bacterium]
MKSRQALGPIMIGVEGAELSAQERELLRHPQVGGVILFTRNFESAAQVAALNAEIHALRDTELLIAVDQEGGRVQRFRDGFTRLPPIATLGRVYDESPERALVLAETAGWLMAIELRCVGIDISFAPVLDLDRGVSGVIGDRAFHSDPETIAILAGAYVRGMHRAGMAATGKHYPGHGSVAADSHLELPVDPRSFERIVAEDLIPFARMAEENTLDAVMASHVRYLAVDERLAGFSPFWLQEVLRKQLGFTGVIFSDDLLMEAAVVAGDVPARAEAALAAGCDMVLICRGLKEAAATAEQLDRSGWHSPLQSQERIMRLGAGSSIRYRDLIAGTAWQEAVRAVSTISV